METLHTESKVLFQFFNREKENLWSIQSWKQPGLVQEMKWHRVSGGLNIDSWIVAESAVKSVPDRLGEEVAELKGAAIHLLVDVLYVPVLTHGHQLWVMTKRMRSESQTEEIDFFLRVRSSDSPEETCCSFMQSGVRWGGPSRLHNLQRFCIWMCWRSLYLYQSYMAMNSLSLCPLT